MSGGWQPGCVGGDRAQGGEEGSDGGLEEVEAHGDERHAQEDVDGGEQDPDHVLLLPAAQLEPGHPDRGQEGEAVVERVDRADTVKVKR